MRRPARPAADSPRAARRALEQVGRAENADYFYRVYKNEQQYSVVQRVPIADF